MNEKTRKELERLLHMIEGKSKEYTEKQEYEHSLFVDGPKEGRDAAYARSTCYAACAADLELIRDDLKITLMEAEE